MSFARSSRPENASSTFSTDCAALYATRLPSKLKTTIPKAGSFSMDTMALRVSRSQILISAKFSRPFVVKGIARDARYCCQG